MATQEITVTMTREGARELVEQINDHLTQAGVHLGMARKLLWTLKDQRGWEALGYTSWRSCVLAEFDQRQAQLYRQLKAAEVEMATGLEVGTFPERVLRPLSPFSPEEQKKLLEAAQVLRGPGGRVTSGDTQAIADMAQEWRHTGSFTDGEGEQFSLGEKFGADLLGRIHETMQRQRDHIQEANSRLYHAKGVTAMVLMCTQKANGKFRVVVELEAETCLNGGQEFKVNLWE